MGIISKQNCKERRTRMYFDQTNGGCGQILVSLHLFLINFVSKHDQMLRAVNLHLDEPHMFPAPPPHPHIQKRVCFKVCCFYQALVNLCETSTCRSVSRLNSFHHQFQRSVQLRYEGHLSEGRDRAYTGSELNTSASCNVIVMEPSYKNIATSLKTTVPMSPSSCCYGDGLKSDFYNIQSKHEFFSPNEVYKIQEELYGNSI